MIAATELVELSDGTTVRMYASPPGKIRVDLTDKRFCRLVVLGCLGRSRPSAAGHSATLFAARCDCGRIYSYVQGNLQSGRSTQCRICQRATCTGRPPIHGLSGTPEFSAWVQMIQRCHNSNNPGYRLYGGRGIHVCRRWRDSVKAFLDDVGPRPSPHHSIDRFPDNDGDYEPTNCRWATPKEQCLNSRHPRFFEHNGERLCISDWAAKIGITRERMRQRLRDFPVVIALTTPRGESCKSAVTQGTNQ